MENYILDRLKTDAIGLLSKADNYGKIQHSGLKGRFRELLINDILIPWLPPYTSCGTGTIIDSPNTKRTFTQDDIIIYDTSLTPPILVSNQSPEGVFLYNSVLMRIEVKSLLNKNEIRNFIKASKEIADLKLALWQTPNKPFIGALNMLFAYDSDLTEGNDNKEIQRITETMEEYQIDPTSGIVSVICIAKRGLWKICEKDGNRFWGRLKYNDSASHIAWFVGCLSNSCYLAHAERQGRDPKLGVECGIGRYIPGDVWESC